MELQDEKLVLLSKGSNSLIYFYGDGDDGLVLKMVPTTSIKQLKHLQNEYKMLKSLNEQHPHIISVLKYKQHVKLNGSKYNVMVMEYAKYGNLLNFYQKFKMNIMQLRNILKDITSAVHYLHCNYIVHRDLKLENILVIGQHDEHHDDKYAQIKLADFGFADQCSESKLYHSFKGTKRGYMAPQIHNILDGSQKNYDGYSSDIFALGVIMFSLIMGKLPFEYANPKTNKLYKLIKQKEWKIFWTYHQQALNRLQIQNQSMLEEFKQLFMAMVSFNPEERLTINEVLQHPWMNGVIAHIKL